MQEHLISGSLPLIIFFPFFFLIPYVKAMKAQPKSLL